MATRPLCAFLSLLLLTITISRHPTNASDVEEEDGDIGVPSVAQDYLDYIEGGGQEDGYDDDDDDDEEFENTVDNGDQHDDNGGEEGNDVESDYDEERSVTDQGIPDGDNDEPGSLLSNFIGSYFDQYKGRQPHEVQTIFSAHLRNMDANKDSQITFDEFRAWLGDLSEKEVIHADARQLGLTDVDKNGDGKLSMEEVMADLITHSNSKPNPSDIRYEKLRFKYSDRNNDSFINSDEFGRFAMPDLFLDMQEMQVDQYIASYDKDEDDLISKDEFIADIAMAASNKADIFMEEENFRDLDVNNDGRLEKEEIRDKAMEYSPLTMIDKELKAIIAICDVNKDGVLSYDELTAKHEYLTDRNFAPDISDHHDRIKDEL